MKKTTLTSIIVFCALTLMIFVFASSQIAYAHPPQDVQLSYDLKAQTLSVTIVHKTGFGFHYIDSIIVKKNGIEVSTSKYDNQPDPAKFTYTYKVAAGKGDSLEVTVKCNLSGSKTETLSVK